MFVYTVAIAVPEMLRPEFERWMLNAHIQAVLGTGCFVKSDFHRITETSDNEPFNYSALYYCTDEAQYRKYIEQYSREMRNDVLAAFPEGLTFKRSFSQVL